MFVLQDHTKPWILHRSPDLLDSWSVFIPSPLLLPLQRTRQAPSETPRSLADPRSQPRRAEAGSTPAPYEHHFRGQHRVLVVPAVCPALMMMTIWRQLSAEEAHDHWLHTGCSTRHSASRTRRCAFVVQTEPCYFPFPSCTKWEGMTGKKDLKVFFIRPFTVPSIWVIQGISIHPMPPCFLDHFSFGGRKGGGKSSHISNVQR